MISFRYSFGTYVSNLLVNLKSREVPNFRPKSSLKTICYNGQSERTSLPVGTETYIAKNIVAAGVASERTSLPVGTETYGRDTDGPRYQSERTSLPVGTETVHQGPRLVLDKSERTSLPVGTETKIVIQAAAVLLSERTSLPVGTETNGFYLRARIFRPKGHPYR